MDKKNIVILGSTGSIGKSALDVIGKHSGSFRVRALAAYSSVDLIEEQYHRFLPDYICLVDKKASKELASRLASNNVTVVAGEDELIKLASIENADVILNAVVGAAGLRVSLETLKFGRTLALANKESLVVGGPLFARLCDKTGAQVLPIDSEHSAIWQAMAAGREEDVRSIILTSSGGPFRTLEADKFGDITVEQALDHPTWKMGPKISIDSATLANKGLEVIEAAVLFSMPIEKIKVVVHPQSIIHSMVEFKDSSVIAQLSVPDMRLPITYALFYPERVESDFGRIDWTKLPDLTFEEPDYERFPALKTAFEVAGVGGTAPALFNASNEAAVEAFLARKIKFVEISRIIRSTIEELDIVNDPDLDQIIDADRRAREFAGKMTEKLAC